MKVIFKFVLFCDILYRVSCIYVMENETEHAFATDSSSLDSEYYSLINATNRDPVTFLQKMDALLVNQLTQPVKNYSVTISYSINEYNKVLDDILSKLLAKNIYQQQEIISLANIVCKTLRPKFTTLIINFDSMRKIFEWDDIDIQVFYSLNETTKELWREMTQAYNEVRAQRKKMKNNSTDYSFSKKPKTLHNQTRQFKT